MSNLIFKEDNYTISELISLRSMSPFYKSGDVLDTTTGEVLDIQDIDKWREVYINELISSKELNNILQKKDTSNRLKILEDKYRKAIINKSELLELIKLKHNRFFEISYEDYYLLNVAKGKPKDLPVIDYGRFIMMLDFMTKENTIAHKSNGKQIKESDLIEYIELKNKKSFQNLLSKLSKLGLIAKNGYGNKRFIHINPIYAKRRIKIDETIYFLFRDDIKQYLSEYEIKYFEMNNENEELSESTFEIID